jgi:protein SCO1/2
MIGLVVTSAALANDIAPDLDSALKLSQSAVGTELHDYHLLNGNGKALRLSGFRGKPLLVQFVYTSCSQACPVSVRYLKQGVDAARDALGADAFSVITVGFNYPFDTPQAMSAFAKRHGISDTRWHFLAADSATLDDMTRALGFSWYATPKGFDHIAQVSVVDANGRIYRQVYGEQIDVPSLVEPLKQLVTGQHEEAGDWRAFVEKVRLFCTVYDNASGRYRFDYSLILEIIIGAGVLFGGGLVLASEWRKARRNS